MMSRFRAVVRRTATRGVGAVRRRFAEHDPTFRGAFAPALFVAALLYMRSPASNYIFDEQEALLANPYVNGDGIGFFQVLQRDFWGLPPDRSIGSYRPLPNVIWRALWRIHPVFENPWIHHAVNVVIHAANAALVAAIAFRFSRRREVGWLAGGAFVTSAILTEAVTGVVGLADVLGGLGILLAVLALYLPLWAMPLSVFGALTLGFFSKESTLVAVPILAWTALLAAPVTHPARPLRGARAALALTASIAALVFYTETRRRFFPVAIPDELLTRAADAPWHRQLFHDFLRWFSQPRLPQDPINNPLVNADVAHRVAGALCVYEKGFFQALFPWTLSGDYSYPQEPVPAAVITPASVAGALLMALPVLAAVALLIACFFTEKRERSRESFQGGSARLRALIIFAVSCFWLPVAYFPHSNIVFLLPTVRAERFWYVPVIAIALLLGVVFAGFAGFAGQRSDRAVGRWAVGIIGAFFAFQSVRARMHALDYSDDLVFWRSTAAAAPMSAKAHLNYGVMLGARGQLEQRLVQNGWALRLAPEWPMANVYFADTLCRLSKPEKAWQHYVKGFELAPNDRNLIALGLQCLWDQKAITMHKPQLLLMANKHPGSWLAYLVRDIVYNGEKHKGVDPKHRPRGYDEGPKD